MPDMNIARKSPTGVCVMDYLYVFGGKATDNHYIRQIERINLKLCNKFEVLADVQLQDGITDMGIVPITSNHQVTELMLLGGFGVNGNVSKRYRFTVVLGS
jgi:hypothetical protein